MRNELGIIPSGVSQLKLEFAHARFLTPFEMTDSTLRCDRLDIEM
jgi:hypothetical protein